MADIEIVYEVRRCDLSIEGHFTQCHTPAAGDWGCSCYESEPIRKKTIDGRPVTVFPSHICTHAKTDYAFKGWSGKRYEICEPDVEFGTCEVRLGNTVYCNCVRVKLDGEIIFDTYSGEETEHGQTD